MEIQIHLKEIYDLNKRGHKLYEIFRAESSAALYTPKTTSDSDMLPSERAARESMKYVRRLSQVVRLPAFPPPIPTEEAPSLTKTRSKRDLATVAMFWKASKDIRARVRWFLNMPQNTPTQVAPEPVNLTAPSAFEAPGPEGLLPAPASAPPPPLRD